MTATKKIIHIGTREDQGEELKEPPMFNVVFHNDDFTPMDFVTYLLIGHYHHPVARARALMLQVHEKGSAIAGTYPFGVAETKAAFSTQAAKLSEYPLKITVEPKEA